MSENKKPTFQMIGLAIDSNDAVKLGTFYQKMLGWKNTHEGGEWYGLGVPGQEMTLAFQTVENYQLPTWPYEVGKPGQMLHLDFYVENVEEAVAYAIECGATIARDQFYEEYGSKTMIDPAGHPFCLVQVKG